MSFWLGTDHRHSHNRNSDMAIKHYRQIMTKMQSMGRWKRDLKGDKILPGDFAMHETTILVDVTRMLSLKQTIMTPLICMLHIK